MGLKLFLCNGRRANLSITSPVPCSISGIPQTFLQVAMGLQCCCEATVDYSAELDAPRDAPGPQPGNRIEFPNGTCGVVVRRTQNALLLNMKDGQQWVPLSGL